jgi:hypothetical protein
VLAVVVVEEEEEVVVVVPRQAPSWEHPIESPE